MRVHWLQHAPLEGPGALLPWFAARGWPVSGCHLYRGDALPALQDLDALVVLGGPMNIYEHEAHPWLVAEKQLIRAALDAGRPVLGICLGAQLMADVLGGPVTRNPQPEIGWWPIEPVAPDAAADGAALPVWPADCPLAGLPAPLQVFHWHGDTYALPPGARGFAASAACAQQGFLWGEHAIGLQFHPEVQQADVARWLEGEVLPSGPYVQPAAQILADAAGFARGDALCAQLLHRLFADAV